MSSPMMALADALRSGSREALEIVKGLTGDNATVVRYLIAHGVTDEDILTNCLFFREHPELNGRKLDPHGAADALLRQQWLRHRDREVRPALARSAPDPVAPSGPVDAGPPLATDCFGAIVMTETGGNVRESQLRTVSGDRKSVV